LLVGLVVCITILIIISKGSQGVVLHSLAKGENKMDWKKDMLVTKTIITDKEKHTRIDPLKLNHDGDFSVQPG